MVVVADKSSDSAFQAMNPGGYCCKLVKVAHHRRHAARVHSERVFSTTTARPAHDQLVVLRQGGGGAIEMPQETRGSGCAAAPGRGVRTKS